MSLLGWGWAANSTEFESDTFSFLFRIDSRPRRTFGHVAASLSDEPFPITANV
jgi:hypothetical protein